MTLTFTYMIPCYNSGSRLGRVFEKALQEGAREIKKLSPQSAVLVVNNSTPADHGLTEQIARDNGAEIISAPKISVGFARFAGLDHAFNNMNSKFVFIGDDDLHTPASGLETLNSGLKEGAALVIGCRGITDLLTHPPLQLLFESALNSAAALLTLRRCDLISGSAAFSRIGWISFRPFVSESLVRQMKTAIPFIVPVYDALGLKISTKNVPGQYEGDYLRDSFNFGISKRRYQIIRGDFADLLAGIKLARMIY